jgi:hypothetical protein
MKGEWIFWIDRNNLERIFVLSASFRANSQEIAGERKQRTFSSFNCIGKFEAFLCCRIGQSLLHSPCPRVNDCP